MMLECLLLSVFILMSWFVVLVGWMIDELVFVVIMLMSFVFLLSLSRLVMSWWQCCLKMWRGRVVCGKCMICGRGKRGSRIGLFIVVCFLLDGCLLMQLEGLCVGQVYFFLLELLVGFLLVGFQLYDGQMVLGLLRLQNFVLYFLYLYLVLSLGIELFWVFGEGRVMCIVVFQECGKLVLCFFEC